MTTSRHVIQISAFVSLIVVGIWTSGGAQEQPTFISMADKLPLALVSVVSPDANRNPEFVIDGDPNTEFTFKWANGGATLVFDLARISHRPVW